LRAAREGAFEESWPTAPQTAARQRQHPRAKCICVAADPPIKRPTGLLLLPQLLVAVLLYLLPQVLAI
jgi:hypothetical protein